MPSRFPVHARIARSVGRTGHLRLGAYAAAPAQRVLTPRLTTSLFPQLPPRSRSAFGAGLLVLCAALASFQNVGGIASALRIVLSPEMSRELHNALQHLVQVHLTGMRQLKSEQIFSRIQS